MGEVWEAVLVGPRGFRKPVALKLLRGEAVASASEALCAEARIGALLSHPNVVGTLELGEADGQWYVAMELVRGVTVGVLARQGRTPGAILDVGVQACSGLAHIHAHGGGVVHRDIKPANLLVDRTGLVKIADLGIARLVGGAGRPAGTLGYMPREQLHGREDHRADVFALGATLAALALGRCPFGKGRAALAAVADAEAHLAASGALQQVDAVVPGLASLLQRCLRSDPEERWSDAASLGRALRALRGRSGAGAGLVELLGTVRPDIDPDEAVSASAGSHALTQRVTRGNLPAPPDELVGRATERAQLKEVLAGPALVTLLGPGGTGKTRLALAAAWDLEVMGGAWFCDLSEARTAVGICSVVSGVLDVPLVDADPVQRIGHALAARGRIALVLDNLEQVILAASEVVACWRKMAPEATLLATSQIPLRCAGEQVVEVGPLAPAAAVALLRARAWPGRGPIELGVARAIVQRLEGSPLAIELAAARTRLLAPEALLERLKDRFRILARRSATGPARHRSLRASLDASWSLLKPWEQAALSSLAVFADGFTLEAAEAVLDLERWHEAPWAMDVVAELVDHSLVQVSADRFRLLGSVQEYALEHLQADERTAAERRHGELFAQLGAPAALGGLRARGARERLAALALELENLIAATKRAAARGDASVAVGAALAAAPVFAARGPFQSGWALLEEARTAGATSREPELLRGMAVFASGLGRMDEAHALLCEALVAEDDGYTRRALARVLRSLGRVEEALTHVEAGLALHRASGDRSGQAEALRLLGDLRMKSGGGQPEALLTEALALCEASGDRQGEAVSRTSLARYYRGRGVLERGVALGIEAVRIHGELGYRAGVANALAELGLAYQEQGRFDQARGAHDKALALCRAMGDRRGEARAKGNLGIIHWEQGRPEHARDLYEAAIEMHRETGNRLAEGVVLGNLASVCGRMGDTERARALFREAIDVCRATGNVGAVAIALGNLGELHHKVGDLAAARAVLEEGVELARSVGQVGPAAAFLAALAEVRAEAGDTDVEPLLDRAEADLRASGHRYHVAAVLVRRGRVALLSGDLERARAWLDDARALAEAIGSGPESDLVARLVEVEAELCQTR